jgi:hypothetical protein
MTSESRKDDLIGAVAVIVLLIGTSTGNAYAMLGMSVATLFLIAMFRQKQLVGGGLMVALAAAVTAALLGVVIVMQ